MSNFVPVEDSRRTAACEADHEEQAQLGDSLAPMTRAPKLGRLTTIEEVNSSLELAAIRSNASQDDYVKGLEKLLSDVEAAFKKRRNASQALIVRQAIEIGQLREDLSAKEQSTAVAIERLVRDKEKCMLQAQKEEKLLKKNDDLESRHNEDTARFDALVRRSNILVAKANVKIETLEEETTLRISCLEVEKRKSKLKLLTTQEKTARLEQEIAELTNTYDDLVV